MLTFERVLAVFAEKVLADKGLRTLLVERHKLPRYKSCAGVLIQKTMDLVRRYYGQNVPAVRNVYPSGKPGHDLHGR